MESVGVVGLGYVGLPLAVHAAEKGQRVVGVDIDETLVDMVNRRESPYVNDPRFNMALSAISSPALRATTHYQELKSVDAIIICVPTPTENNKPDISYVTQSAVQVGDQLRSGQLVSLESTVNPGVTRDHVLPILEQRSGLTAGHDFNLVHCPERIDPGNPRFFVGNLNRVVGGVTPGCTYRAVDFYTGIIDAEIIPLDSLEEAEFVKSWENSQRNIMIAMANGAAIICDALGMNIDNIQRGLQSKVDQFGLQLAKAGIGPGGHCIPEDIHYVIRKAREHDIDTRFLDDAADLNEKMPLYAVNRLSKMIKDAGDDQSKLRVALLGLSYKPSVADIRRSPSIEVGYHLMRRFGSIVLHDPFATMNTNTIKGADIALNLEDALAGSDALFIGTAHAEYIQKLTAGALKDLGIRYVLDGRNCLDQASILELGINYRGIGR